jgi:hypothetical protein
MFQGNSGDGGHASGGRMADQLALPASGARAQQFNTVTPAQVLGGARLRYEYVSCKRGDGADATD